MSRPPDFTTTYEVLGSYFVDIYFNVIFESCGRDAAGSITDAYRDKVDAFIRGMKQDEHSYDKIVQRLYEYFRTHLRFTTLSFAEFVDVVVKTLAPPDYFEQLRAKEKDTLLQTVLISLIVDLGAHAVSPDMIRRVIDRQGGQSQVTIQMLQDKAVEVLILKRDEIMHAFMGSKHRASAGGVSPEVVAQLQEALRKVLKKLQKESAAAAAAAERAEGLENELLDARRRAAKLEKIVMLLREERANGPGAAVAAAGAAPRDTLGERVAPRPGRFNPASIAPAPDTVGEHPRAASDGAYSAEYSGSSEGDEAGSSSEAEGSEAEESEAEESEAEEESEESVSSGGRRPRPRAPKKAVAAGFFSDDEDDQPRPAPRRTLGGAIKRSGAVGRRMAAPPEE